MIKGASVVAAALLAAAVTSAAAAAPFKLSSDEIKPGARIKDEQAFNGFGCSGKNVSPTLHWSGAPAGTKSFVLLVHDPDAPTGGSGWWHWAVVDIPADATGLAKGAGAADGAALPKGAKQIATDFGAPGWGGPCPPAGDKPHHYRFSVYALKVDHLDLPANATPALVGFMANANAIGKAQLVGTYARPAK